MILSKYDLKFRMNINFPPHGNYHPKRNSNPECDIKNVRIYVSLIGILRWLVELGRIDMTCELSIVSSYTAMPREGHLYHLIDIFFII